jgi:hypothetical protein
VNGVVQIRKRKLFSGQRVRKNSLCIQRVNRGGK